MKRIIVALSLVLVFAGTLLIVVFAHGGRTDANGGHYNRSTGEYHYHHGYSAHSHYDMDGDGYLDCPYAFDDKTNHGSGKIDRTPETTKKTDLQDLFDRNTQKAETTASKKKENTDSDDVPLWIELLIFAGLGVVFYQYLKRTANKNNIK